MLMIEEQIDNYYDYSIEGLTGDSVFINASRTRIAKLEPSC